MRRCLLGLLVLLSLAPAAMAASTAKDCEAIKNPMEFNLCLASLSPVRGSRAARAARRGPPEASVPQGQGRMARGGRKSVASRPDKVKLPEGALQMVNGRVRLSISPRQ